MRVNDWRDTKLELNYLFYSVTVKVYCQLENEYKLINSIFVWHAAERGVMEGGCFTPELSKCLIFSLFMVSTSAVNTGRHVHRETNDGDKDGKFLNTTNILRS